MTNRGDTIAKEGVGIIWGSLKKLRVGRGELSGTLPGSGR